jgi:hypothetical protein
MWFLKAVIWRQCEIGTPPVGTEGTHHAGRRKEVLRGPGQKAANAKLPANAGRTYLMAASAAYAHPLVHATYRVYVNEIASQMPLQCTPPNAQGYAHQLSASASTILRPRLPASATMKSRPSMMLSLYEPAPLIMPQPSVTLCVQTGRAIERSSRGKWIGNALRSTVIPAETPWSRTLVMWSRPFLGVYRKGGLGALLPSSTTSHIFLFERGKRGAVCRRSGRQREEVAAARAAAAVAL